MSGYPTSKNIPRVDGLSTEPRGSGRHSPYFFGLKSKGLLIFSNQIVIVFSLMEIAIYFIFVLGLESLRFYARTLLLTIFLHPLFLSIWQRNLKLNGGQLSKSLIPKLLTLSKNGFIPKNPKPLQKSFLFHHPFGHKLHQNPLFLQIQPIKTTSENSKHMLLKHYHNLLTMMKTMRIQHLVWKIKMKTCVMDSHTLPLSNGTSSSIFKSLVCRKIKIFKIPKSQIFHLIVNRFIEILKEDIKTCCKCFRD